MWPMRRIFVVLDGSPECQSALNLAQSVATTDPEELVLVTVIPSFHVIPSRTMVAFTDFAEAAGRAKSHLDEQASRISDHVPGLRVRTLVKVSPLSAADMTAELMHLATEEGCDLIIMTATSEVSEAARAVLSDDGPAVLLVPPAPTTRPSRPGHPVRLSPLRLRPSLALGSLFSFAEPAGSGSLSPRIAEVGG